MARGDSVMQGRAPMAMVSVLFVVVTGCGSTGSSGDNAGSDSSDPSSKYEQTWTRPYGQTTCRQWLNRMSPGQRFAGAADMLTGARNKGDGGSGLPPDSLINQFKRDMDDACVNPSQKLTEIGAAVYLTGRSKYRP
jgi:hypothetical protein